MFVEAIKANNVNKGGCLCGATIWIAQVDPTSVHYCHCSMCRRWTGGAFAILAWYPRAAVSWPGRQPAEFRSSSIAVRSHCSVCGTPLTLAYHNQDVIALTVGSMDAPEKFAPSHHYGIEGRLPWVDIGPTLPTKVTEESP